MKRRRGKSFSTLMVSSSGSAAEGGSTVAHKGTTGEGGSSTVGSNVPLTYAEVLKKPSSGSMRSSSDTRSPIPKKWKGQNVVLKHQSTKTTSATKTADRGRTWGRVTFDNRERVHRYERTESESVHRSRLGAHVSRDEQTGRGSDHRQLMPPRNRRTERDIREERTDRTPTPVSSGRRGGPTPDPPTRPAIPRAVDAHFHPARLMAATGTTTLASALASLPGPDGFTISGFVGVFCSPSTWTTVRQRVALRKDSRLVYAYGWHPKKLLEGRGIDDEEYWEHLDTLLGTTACVAMGEIGLDYSPQSPDERIQKMMLAKLLRLGVSKNRAIVIHCRDRSVSHRKASEECLAIMKRELPINHRIHWHCFNGSISEFRAIREAFPNCYFGIAGLATMDSCHPQLSGVIISIPENRLLLETDSPHLKTKGETARHNSPYLLNKVGKYVAELRNVGLSHLFEATADNAQRCYQFRARNQ
jgi:TatD family hydrolase